ncbi:MAG: acetyl-CoA acetyltransferase [Gammaproteobacteria bacterium]|nr:acetyl-CoA acetyltransferase [Gammaproteobacteria bacterium]
MMEKEAARIPVIVGVGQLNDRPSDPDAGLDSQALMREALRLADRDAGGGWLARLDALLVVNQISCPELGDVAAGLAAELGIAPKICQQTEAPMGDSPMRLLNDAANLIASGDIRVAAIVGGEALRTAAKRSKRPDGQAGSALEQVSARRAGSYRARYGLSTALDLYPLYENATRAAYGQTLGEAQQESGEIWKRFADAAVANDGAWIRDPKTVDEIITPSASNRLITFPYTKLMVANSSVNQGAGFLVTSLAHARDLGVAEDRLVYVGLGAAAHEPTDPLARDGYRHSVGMEVSLTRALELNRISVEQLDHVELYSCFPCVPKMARRVLGLSIDKPFSVCGGLTFCGGPIANYMSHAVVSMVQKLRESGKYGLLFANGGFATHNHSIVLGSEPLEQAKFPQDYDYQREADAARGPVPEVVETYTGPARLESYTLPYTRDGHPGPGVVMALTPDGRRTLAQVAAENSGAIERLLQGAPDLIGAAGDVAPGDEDIQVWSFAVVN